MKFPARRSAEMSRAARICRIHTAAPNPNYIRLTAYNKFRKFDWWELPDDQLDQLLAILLNLRARRENAERLEKQQLQLL